MIVSGEPISAAEALKSGLVDEIIDGSSTTAGETFARTILAGKIPMRRLRDDDTKLLAASNDRMIFTNAVVKERSCWRRSFRMFLQFGRHGYV